MRLPYEIYQSGDYFRDNPDWDMADSPWKALQVVNALQRNNIKPTNIAEVGCGAGKVLAELETHLPQTSLVGYDISPDVQIFWERHQSERISFVLGDFLELSNQHFDALLLLDVIEHLPDPHAFLKAIRTRADYFVFHIPLDLSSISVVREKPLLHVRNKVGHIHYFTKNLALALIRESGYSIIDWCYTGAAYSVSPKNWKNIFANILRRLICKFHKDMGVRLLGGETLIVVAKMDDIA